MERKRPLGARLFEPANVFLSYAPADDNLAVELEKHLAQLERAGVLQGWSSRKIGAGQEWRGKVDAQLDRAHVILLLVSADFMASDYLNDVEVERAMARHEAGDARVIPIILRAYRWEDAPFGRLTPLPLGGRPVTDTSAWPQRDTAFKSIADGIVAALADLTSRRRSAPTTEQPAVAAGRTGRLARAALGSVLAVLFAGVVAFLIAGSGRQENADADAGLDAASLAPQHNLRACCRDTADSTSACARARSFAVERQLMPFRCRVCALDEKQTIDPNTRWSMWLDDVRGPPSLLSGAVCAQVGDKAGPESAVCRDFHRLTAVEPWRLSQARSLPVTVEDIVRGRIYLTLYAAGGESPEGMPLAAAPGHVETHEAGVADDLYSTALCEGARLHVRVVDDEGVSHDDVTVMVYLLKPAAH